MSYDSTLIARGLKVYVGIDAHDEMVPSLLAGTVSARDVLSLLDSGAGVWWGVMGDFGDLEDFEDYAYSDDLLADTYEDLDGGDISVVLIGKRPTRDGESWDPERHNPPEAGGLMGNSYLDPGEPVELIEVRYDAGKGWKSLPARGLRVKASAEKNVKMEVSSLLGSADRFEMHEVDVGGVSTTRCIAIYDHQWGFSPMGFITWDPDDGNVEMVYLDEELRGRGFATRLLEAAQRAHGRPLGARGEFTEAGEAWARSKGMEPQVEARMSDAEMKAAGSRMLVALHRADSIRKLQTFSSKVALPSWRDRGERPQAEAIIAPDLGRGRRNSYEVILYGQPHARRDSLAEAKATVEAIYGDLEWEQVPGDQMPHHDPVHGWTTMFNDADYYYVVRRLPRLGATGSSGARGDLPEGLVLKVFDQQFGGKFNHKRGVQAILDGKVIGNLLWFTDESSGMGGHRKGEIVTAWVDEAYRRQGIASAMLAKGREADPWVHHSDALSPDAEAWSQHVASATGSSGQAVPLRYGHDDRTDYAGLLRGGSGGGRARGRRDHLGARSDLVLSVGQVERIAYGSVRDQGLLESAVGQQQWHEDIFDRAAALGYSLARNHPFDDGNKRTAWVSTRTLLRMAGYRIKPRQNEAVRLMVGVAEGTVSRESFSAWLQGNSRTARMHRTAVDDDYANESEWFYSLGPNHDLTKKRRLSTLEDLAYQVAQDYRLNASAIEVVQGLYGRPSTAEYDWSTGVGTITIAADMQDRWTLLHEMVHLYFLTEGSDEIALYHDHHFDRLFTEFLKRYGKVDVRFGSSPPTRIRLASRGLWWRSHPKEREFGPDDAISRPWGRTDDEQPGYSAMSGPWELWGYWADHANVLRKDGVIAFSGTRVGSIGFEGLIEPDMQTVHRMSWEEFEQMLTQTPIPARVDLNTSAPDWQTLARRMLQTHPRSVAAEYLLGKMRSKRAVAADLDHWRPTKGMFARGQDTLDPRVFDTQTEHMLPAVHDAVLDALDAYWTPKYGDWRAWAKVYLAGSGASYWWDSDADMDILIGVDLDRLREARPANKEVADEEIVAHLNRGLKEDLRPTTTEFLGLFEATWFINAGAYHITAIHPYAAYDITADDWVVKPPVLPANWGPSSIPESIWRRVEQTIRSAQQVLALPEPERTVAGTVFFNWIHEERRASYSAYGGGWLSFGNVCYQALSQHPDHLLRMLYLCKHPEEETSADSIEVTAVHALQCLAQPSPERTFYQVSSEYGPSTEDRAVPSGPAGRGDVVGHRLGRHRDDRGDRVCTEGQGTGPLRVRLPLRVEATQSRVEMAGPLALAIGDYSDELTQKILSAIKKFRQGRITPDPKRHGPLKGTYTIPVGAISQSSTPDRLLLIPQESGVWLAIFYVHNHNYGPAERAIPEWLASMRRKRLGARSETSARKEASGGRTAGAKTSALTFTHHRHLLAEEEGVLVPTDRDIDSLGAYDGDRLVGYISWMTSGGLVKGGVDALWVAPSHRRQGLATQLLRRAQQIDPEVDPHNTPWFTEDGEAWIRSLARVNTTCQ